MVNITQLTRRGSTCTDFLTCIYDLSTSDAYVFSVLKKNGTMTLDQLSEKIHRNRSTVFKSLQRLVSVGIVYKTPRTLQAGGKYYEFHVNDPLIIRKRAEAVVSDIQNSMKKLLNDLEIDLKS